MTAMFLFGSRRNEEFLLRTLHTFFSEKKKLFFLEELTYKSYELLVSEEKIFKS